MKILIIEDQEGTQRAFKEFSEPGWEVFPATSCIAARDLLQRLGPVFDVYVVDLMLPEQVGGEPVVDKGFELIEEILARDLMAQIVLITIVDDYEVVRKAMELGVFSFVSKTAVSWLDLAVGLIKRAFENRQRVTAVAVRVGRDGRVLDQASMGIIEEQLRVMEDSVMMVRKAIFGE